MPWRPFVLLASTACRSWSAETAEGRATADVEVRLAAEVVRVAAARERPLDVPDFREVTAEQMRDISRTEYQKAPATSRAWSMRFGQAFGVYGDTDPMEALLSSAVVAGMWLHEQDRMYVQQESSRGEAVQTWQHELVHALQDRHFDIFPPGIYDWPSDIQQAHGLLVEGEATYIPLVIAFGAGVVDWTPLSDLGIVEKKVGRDIQRRYLASAMRTYAQGPAVIQALRQQGGWAAVDARWHDLPLSTEQLLEPDRAGDLPRYLTLDVQEALPAGWTADDADTLGQQEMYDVLWASLPDRADEVAEAVRGWDGDRVRVLVRDGAPIGFVWRSAWDSPADAEAFAALVARWTPAGRTPTVEIRGDEVLVACIEGPSAPDVRAAAWNHAFVEVGSMDALLAAHAIR